jgi:hypothetical protein
MLSFTISTPDLDAVIGALKDTLPETLYPIAWRILTAERERRTSKAPAASIIMARQVFEDLPPPIKQLFGTPVVS